ncbi:MAG TPA: hypothetical protein VF874_06210, partial [Mycobacterium sp.]
SATDMTVRIFLRSSCRRYAFAVASNLNGIGLNAATAVDRSGRISVRQPLPKTARAGWPLS